ncbi:MAG: hypothetical protein JWQ71_1336 [Pedosphaera sp.]|nr:hypothetical protein [Pedosphaera sp.]
MPADNPDILYLTVKISTAGISEVSKGSLVVFLRKSDIQRVELASGSGAENPALQLALGLLLAVVGACGLIPLWRGNLIMFRYELGFVFFGLVGLWLIWETLRRRTYLLISTRSIKRKLFFRGRIEPKQLGEFVKEAETNFGYSITSRLDNMRRG